MSAGKKIILNDEGVKEIGRAHFNLTSGKMYVTIASNGDGFVRILNDIGTGQWIAPEHFYEVINTWIVRQ